MKKIILFTTIFFFVFFVSKTILFPLINNKPVFNSASTAAIISLLYALIFASIFSMGKTAELARTKQ